MAAAAAGRRRCQSTINLKSYNQTITADSIQDIHYPSPIHLAQRWCSHHLHYCCRCCCFSRVMFARHLSFHHRLVPSERQLPPPPPPLLPHGSIGYYQQQQVLYNRNHHQLPYKTVSSSMSTIIFSPTPSFPLVYSTLSARPTIDTSSKKLHSNNVNMNQGNVY